MNKVFLATAAIIALTAISANALDLQEARTKGILHENPNGYVSVIKSSGDASALAAQVNAQRKAEYERISKQNGQPVDVVAKIAAEEIAKKVSSGN